MNRDCLYRYITLWLTLKLNQNINLFGSFWWFRAGRHIDGGLTFSVMSVFKWVFSSSLLHLCSAHFVHAPMIINLLIFVSFERISWFSSNTWKSDNLIIRRPLKYTRAPNVVFVHKIQIENISILFFRLYVMTSYVS